MEKRKVKLVIGGIEYSLVTSDDDDYVEAVAVRVDKKIKKIKDIYPQLTNSTAAILTAINLADDYMKLEISVDNLRKEVAEYAKNEKLFSSLLNERNKKIAELENTIKQLKK